MNTEIEELAKKFAVDVASIVQKTILGAVGATPRAQRTPKTEGVTSEPKTKRKYVRKAKPAETPTETDG